MRNRTSATTTTTSTTATQATATSATQRTSAHRLTTASSGAAVAATPATVAVTATRRPSARRLLAICVKPAVFAILLWLAAAAGQIPVPGSPTPITLQTFVVMMAGLMLPWRQAGAAVATYLAAGAVGLPVFAGGMSTAALAGPDAGFLLGFLPGVIITSLIAHAGRSGFGAARPAGLRALLAAARNFAAALVGCVGVVYALGFVIQAALIHAPFTVVALASAAFIAGDALKAVAAAITVTTLAKLR